MTLDYSGFQFTVLNLSVLAPANLGKKPVDLVSSFQRLQIRGAHRFVQ